MSSQGLCLKMKRTSTKTVASTPIRIVPRTSSWPTRRTDLALGMATGTSPGLTRAKLGIAILQEFRDQISRSSNRDSRHHAHVGTPTKSSPSRTHLRQQPRDAGRCAMTRPTSTSCAAARSPHSHRCGFVSATLDHIQCGHRCADNERHRAPTWSVQHHVSKRQRHRSRSPGTLQGISHRSGTQEFRHFLKIFDPNL